MVVHGPTDIRATEARALLPLATAADDPLPAMAVPATAAVPLRVTVADTQLPASAADEPLASVVVAIPHRAATAEEAPPMAAALPTAVADRTVAADRTAVIARYFRALPLQTRAAPETMSLFPGGTQ
jgi:hypothetical protein